MFGDFNQREIHWISNDDGSADVSNAHHLNANSSRFVDILSSCKLVQHNVHLTCNGNQLDLVLTNQLNTKVDAKRFYTRCIGCIYFYKC